MTDYWTDFARESEEHITNLNNALLTLERNPEDEAAMEAIFRIAHTLKGNCGAMGLTRASDLAHAIEDLLDAIRRDEVAAEPDVMDVIFDAVDELEAMLDEAATNATDDDSDRNGARDPSATITALRGHLETGGGPTEIEMPTDDEVDRILARFDRAIDDDHHAFLVRLSITPDETVNNGQRVVEALIDAFDLVGTEPSQQAIENDEFGTTFDAVFASAVGEDAIAAALEPVEAVASFGIVEVTERFDDGEPAELAPPGAVEVDEPDPLADPANEDLSPDDAQDLSVDELLDEFSEFDDLDELVEDVDDDDLEVFDEMGDAGSFDDLFDGESPAEEPVVDPGADASTDPEADEAAEVGQAEPSVGGDAVADESESESDDVDDASAVFAELQEEVEMVGFDELQDELDELEFEEFDSDDEIGMDELLGDDVDMDDNSFLDVESDVAEAAVDELLEDADAVDADVDAVDADPGVAVDEPVASETADSVDEPLVDDHGDERPGDSVSFDESVSETGSADEELDVAAEAGIPGSDDPNDLNDLVDDGAESEIEDALELDEESEIDTEPEVDDVPAPDTDTESALEADQAVDTESEDTADAVSVDEPDLSSPDALDDLVFDADDVDTDDFEADFGLEGASDEAFDESVEAEFDVGSEAEFDDSTEETFDVGSETEFDDSTEETFDVGSEAEFDESTEETFDVGSETEFDVVTDDLEIEPSPFDLEEPDDGGATGFDVDESGIELGTDSGFESDSATTTGADTESRRVYEEVPSLPIPDRPLPTRSDREQAATESDQVQSIRVDVDQVDTLLNKVEGLVTARVRLRHTIEQGADQQDIRRELDALEDLTSELQETVMDVRLVPLETVANRLPRIVRDISRDQGKSVAFEMDGEDVELDRSVLDQIGDPLIHLVRNAVDHGIEPPDVREDAEKPPEGTIRLEATRSRDRVTISITDDGRGLDADDLREAAIEADVLEQETAHEMADSELYDLIFHPGLTTAPEVTDVSGRGVGMDVVQRTIENLEGSVNVESEPGEGTTVTMELPVTVAIAEVLFFEVGGEEFGVPLKAVRDIDDARAIETHDGNPVIQSGATDVPVIDLADRLETSTGGDLEDGNGMVIRIRDELRSVALHCDGVYGQQEVVVKPFEGFMGGIPGLSGATVRGRGEVVNIIDVNTL